MASRIDSLPFFLIYFSFLIETIAQSPFDFTECNGVKICLLSPSNCLQNTDTCTNGVSIKQTGAKTIEIELFANNLPYMGWMAMGFQGVACKNIEGTGGPCMANTPVTECSWTNGRQMTAGLSYNDATPQNLRITNVDALMKAINFTQEVVTQVENMTYCRVSQMVTAAPLNGVFDADKVFQQDSSKNYSILNAVGPGNGTTISKHTAIALSQLRYPVMAPVNSNATTVASIPTTTVIEVTTTTPIPIPSTTSIPLQTTTKFSLFTSTISSFFIIFFGFFFK